jgi:hypothetical protein
MGLCVEVHKLVEPCTKIRHAAIDLITGTKTIYERQLTITQAIRYAESQSRTEPFIAARV